MWREDSSLAHGCLSAAFVGSEWQTKTGKEVTMERIKRRKDEGGFFLPCYNQNLRAMHRHSGPPGYIRKIYKDRAAYKHKTMQDPYYWKKYEQMHGGFGKKKIAADIGILILVLLPILWAIIGNLRLFKP
jgi:hypothetical protein